MSPWEGRMDRLFTVLRLESIRNKIVTLAVAATLVPTLTTALVSYAQNAQSLADQLDQDLHRSVTQTALETDLWLRQQLMELAGLETSYVVSENLLRLSEGGPGRYESAARLEEYVSAVGPRMPDFAEIIVLDAEGEPIASSRPGSTSTMSPNWARSVVGGYEGFDQPHYSEGSGELVAYAGSMVGSASARDVIGGLVARVRLRPVLDMLEANVPTHGGRLLLLSEDAVILASSDEARDLAPWDEDAAVALETPAEVVEYEDDAGERVLVSAVPLAQAGLSVAIELPRNQAYARLHGLRNVTLLLVALLLAVIGSAAYYLGQAIVRPLARLTSGASEVAAGDFSVELPTVGGGEVSALTEVFNNMVRRLQDGRKALDAATSELMERNSELERLSVTDGLTELINRRRGMEILRDEMKRSERYDLPMSLLMVDVDHFKRYNDTHGHLEGDMVLRGVAQAIKQATRGVDTASRFGGEEFMVLLPECDADGAMEAARRMRERLAREPFKGGRVTMSVGAAVFPLHAEDPEGLISAADRALYAAKDAGRDRAELAVVDRGAEGGEEPVAAGAVPESGGETPA